MDKNLNPNVINSIDPPIDEASSWLAGREFSEDKPLLDLAQAVPSYPPAEELTDYMAERVKLFATAQYGPVSGNKKLKTALANHMGGVYGVSIKSNKVLI